MALLVVMDRGIRMMYWLLGVEKILKQTQGRV
jgi:hypothetical protein